eukprot:s7440_g1.t1
MSMMMICLSAARRRHSPEFCYMGLNGIFMRPSAIKAFCLKLCLLRSKVAAGVLSGFRENATMAIAVDARHAMRQGVTFYRSKNGVILTSDRIPSASILFYESLKDNQKYDRRGKPGKPM